MLLILRINKICCHGGRRYSSVFSVESILSKENKRRTISKFAHMQAIRMQPHEPFKKAAVLIPLCVVDNKVSLLYTLRAYHLKSHRGQVSFPGGMLDENDQNLEETALRETREELGLDEENVHVWGCGKFIVTRTDTSVLPVIGQIKGDLSLNSLIINHSEVEEVFVVPLEDLCDPKKLGYTQFRNGYSCPVFLGGPRRIWGLTAVITNAFLNSLIPGGSYGHRVQYVPTIAVSKFFGH